MFRLNAVAGAFLVLAFVLGVRLPRERQKGGLDGLAQREHAYAARAVLLIGGRAALVFSALLDTEKIVTARRLDRAAGWEPRSEAAR